MPMYCRRGGMPEQDLDLEKSVAKHRKWRLSKCFVQRQLGRKGFHTYEPIDDVLIIDRIGWIGRDQCNMCNVGESSFAEILCQPRLANCTGQSVEENRNFVFAYAQAPKNIPVIRCGFRVCHRSGAPIQADLSARDSRLSNFHALYWPFRST